MGRNPGDNRPGTGPGGGGGRGGNDGDRHDAGKGSGRDNTPGARERRHPETGDDDDGGIQVG